MTCWTLELVFDNIETYNYTDISLLSHKSCSGSAMRVGGSWGMLSTVLKKIPQKPNIPLIHLKMEAVYYTWHPKLLPLVFLSEGFKTSLGTDLSWISNSNCWYTCTWCYGVHVKVPAVYVSFSLWELVVSWVCFLGIPLFVKKEKIYCHCLHAGADLDSLPSYGKRANRIHLNNREYLLK